MIRTYQTIVEIFDFGPYVTKIICPLPFAVPAAAVTNDTFNVYVERRDRQTGDILLLPKDFFSAERLPSKGYCPVQSAYPSDADGNLVACGSFVTLELKVHPDLRLNSRIAAQTHNTFIFNDFRMTQNKAIVVGEQELVGLVFDRHSFERFDAAEGWINHRSSWSEMPLGYGYFPPRIGHGLRPLIIWLHGAGEGGRETRIAYLANKTVNLASDRIQAYFDGAYVLAPQAPTMWMDDGSGEYTQSGQSMYSEALKALLDEFVRLHGDIDLQRIYIGGYSNGGFMTMRMIIDYPDYFAAAFPVCEALYDSTISKENIAAIKHIPIWFTHAKNDTVVKPMLTTVPTYERLVAAGAENVHFSYFDNVVDTSGLFRDDSGRPLEFFGHATWHYLLNDDCRLDYDGRPVTIDGREVTLLQWLARQTQ